MKFIFHFILIQAFIISCYSSISSRDKNNALSLLQEYMNRNEKHHAGVGFQKRKGQNDFKSPQKSKNGESSKFKRFEVERQIPKLKAKMLDGMIGVTPHVNRANEISILGPSKDKYTIDPVLNAMRRSMSKYKNKMKYGSKTSDSTTSSSSMELPDWKDEWNEQWTAKKFEAINATIVKGDQVNMLSARPWGVPCGDPNQHDMPWGSCLLPMECEAEFRIYRGDVFCGRTQFVCCAIQLTTYDMYQGFDESFEDTSLETSSEEQRERERGSKETKRRKKAREKRRRRREREKRKRKIKRTIRKIIREIRKILTRSYRNGTTLRKRKTKQLKRFVKSLKEQFKKDRKTVMNIHEEEMIKVDAALQKRLNQIRGMNQDFIKNSTFRDIVVNGTITPKTARMLMQAYPELQSMIKTRRFQKSPTGDDDDLNYDVEYGFLYYDWK